MLASLKNKHVKGGIDFPHQKKNRHVHIFPVENDTKNFTLGAATTNVV
jgi:hypothetical protein